MSQQQIDAITARVMQSLFPVSTPKSRLWAIVRAAVDDVMRVGNGETYSNGEKIRAHN